MTRSASISTMAGWCTSHLTRVLALTITCVACMLHGGCMVPSLQPVAPNAPVASLSWADGIWVARSDDAADSQLFAMGVQSQPDGHARVQFSSVSRDSPPVTLSLDARGFVLDGRLMVSLALDLASLEALRKQFLMFAVPTHVLGRVDRAADGSVTVRFASSEDLMRRMRSQNASLQAMTSGTSSDIALLTGDSAQLTEFFTKGAADDSLFSLRIQFVRPAGGGAAAGEKGNIPAP